MTTEDSFIVELISLLQKYEVIIDVSALEPTLISPANDIMLTMEDIIEAEARQYKTPVGDSMLGFSPGETIQ